MDLDKALRELYEEKKRLDRAIARMEAKLAEVPDGMKHSTRGRKSMSPEERLQVAARMTAYWAARRAQLAAKKDQPSTAEEPTASGEDPPPTEDPGVPPGEIIA